MTLTTVCVLNAFLFYVLEVSNDAIGYLVRTILIVLDVLQFFVHQLLFVDFDGQVKLNRKAISEFGQKKHEEPE